MNPIDEPIRSKAHPLLKRVRAVARGRLAGDVCLAVGERLVADALASGAQVEAVLMRDDLDANLLRRLHEAAGSDASVRTVDRALMDTLGAANATPGVVALLAPPTARDAGDLARFAAELKAPALLLGVYSVSDPGNLGALARCAEAAGAAGIVLAGDGARPFGVKALRGSMGSLLRLPVFECRTLEGALDALSGARFSQVAAHTRGASPLGAFTFEDRTAIWVTSESGETPPEFDRCIGVTIPMLGAAESLNVSVAGALLLYEFTRTHFS